MNEGWCYILYMYELCHLYETNIDCSNLHTGGLLCVSGVQAFAMTMGCAHALNSLEQRDMISKLNANLVQRWVGALSATDTHVR